MHTKKQKIPDVKINILQNQKNPFNFIDKQCSPININLVFQSESNKNRVSRYKQGRSDVKCSNKKQRKQKGSGQPRMGDKSAPQFRGGAAGWGSNGRNNQKNVTKKQRSSALKSKLYQELNSNNITFIDKLDCSIISTKLAIKQLEYMKVNKGKVLIVQDDFSKNTLLSYRNLFQVHLLKTCGLNVTALCKADHTVLTTSALNTLNKRFACNKEIIKNTINKRFARNKKIIKNTLNKRFARNKKIIKNTINKRFARNKEIINNE